jgi:hypothetical protein
MNIIFCTLAEVHAALDQYLVEEAAEYQQLLAQYKTD